MQKPQESMIQISVRVDGSLIDALDRHAASMKQVDGSPMERSQLIRAAIRNLVAKLDKKEGR